MQKHWLITGGTGFIGRALAHSLMANGAKVTILTRNIDRAKQKFSKTTRLITSLDTIDNTENIDIVINLAGEPLFTGLWTQKRVQAFTESRVSTTENLCSLIERLDHKPSVMISGSAIGYYGMDPTQAFTEQSPVGTDPMAQLCENWEKAAQGVTKSGIRLVRLRIGLTLDPSGGMLAPLIKTAKMGVGAKIGDGQQWMSWISLTDLIRLIYFAVETSTINGPLNATAPAPVSQRGFIDALAHSYHRPRWMWIPDWPLKLLLGDMAELLLNGQKVLPQQALSAGFSYMTPTLEDFLATIHQP